MRSDGQKILLVYNGYSCHFGLFVLAMFRKNSIMVVVLPARTPHVLQPLEVSVFGLFKSYEQMELRQMYRYRRILNAYDVSQVIRDAY